MRIIRSAAAMQRLARRWKADNTSVGFVPTMGFLHEGHLSLIRRARKAAGTKGKVVVSIYVNPTQFSPAEDLSRYPRNFKRDIALCGKEGVDVVFAPSDKEMYPGGKKNSFSTFVVEEKLSKAMEGASRPTHFRGVTTVVAKLFNLVMPSFAIFGAKDFQQATIVQRMVRDLNFDLKIIVASTVREADGLAMSSRNKYLNASQREQATVLWRALQMAKSYVRKSKIVPASRLQQAVSRLVKKAPDARLDYVAFFDSANLEPLRAVRPGTQMALAVFVGKTRLIDNATL